MCANDVIVKHLQFTNYIYSFSQLKIMIIITIYSALYTTQLCYKPWPTNQMNNIKNCNINTIQLQINLIIGKLIIISF